MAKVDKAPKEHSLNKELKDTIKNTRERSQRIVKFGKRVAQDFGRVGDLAGIFEPLVDSLSTDSDLETTMDYWKGIRGLTFKMEEGIDKLDLHAVSSTASGTVSELASDTQVEPTFGLSPKSRATRCLIERRSIALGLGGSGICPL